MTSVLRIIFLWSVFYDLYKYSLCFQSNNISFVIYFFLGIGLFWFITLFFMDASIQYFICFISPFGSFIDNLVVQFAEAAAFLRRLSLIGGKTLGLLILVILSTQVRTCVWTVRCQFTESKGETQGCLLKLCYPDWEDQDRQRFRIGSWLPW